MNVLVVGQVDLAYYLADILTLVMNIGSCESGMAKTQIFVKKLTHPTR